MCFSVCYRGENLHLFFLTPMRGKSGFGWERRQAQGEAGEGISLESCAQHSQVIHFRSDTIFVRNREDLQHFPFELNR